MKLNRLIQVFACFFLFTISTTAQTGTPKITKTQVNQQKKIKHGVKNGELTKREVVKLEAQQKHIQNTKQAAKADGVVTKKERVVIRKKQSNANANIYRKKHNQRDRN
ncbi:MAG: hypothetical protein AAGK97_04660 [Bacteroidota bacterium]